MPAVAEGQDENEASSVRSPKPVAASEGQQQAPVTPTASKPAPAKEEMHPSKYHPTTAPEPSSAVRLGFTDVRPGNMNIPSEAQGTPTRANKKMPVTEFTFRFARGAADVPLSENAQRLMNELREQANLIKADMQAQRDADGVDFSNRKIAQPRSSIGRFSAAHMAEFKKMDSIEGHASLWRANRTPGTPGTPEAPKASLKRSPSKANLDGTPNSPKPNLKRSPSKANLDSTPQSQLKQSLKRSTSRAKLDDQNPAQSENVNFSVSGRPGTMPKVEAQSTFAKRIKKLQHDDASTSRPISRDGTAIPGPKSSGTGTLSPSKSLSRLASPTKASLGHLSTPSKSTISLVGSPSRNELSSLTKSASTTQLAVTPSKSAEIRRRIVSPGRFQKVKSILRGQTSGSEDARTALPRPASQMSRTPGPPTVDKELPPLPLTTPRRKLVKRVAFTPDTKHAVETQNTPSPQKSAPRSQAIQAIQFPTLDGVLAKSTAGDVVYPDLSSLKQMADSQENRKPLPQSVAGTFTFRSDHTIDFGAAPPTGFGACPGQSSIRQVRTSMLHKGKMPGSFPAPPSPSTHPNKENTEPVVSNIIPGAPHGMPNKKRHRAASEEHDVEREGAERGAKKRKNEPTPKSRSLFGSRSVSSTPLSSAKKLQTSRTPSRTVASPSPTKKKGGLSMSRLNMLARPKSRA